LCWQLCEFPATSIEIERSSDFGLGIEYLARALPYESIEFSFNQIQVGPAVLASLTRTPANQISNSPIDG